jgi:uncharacterized membrane protein HdeD (DUF308 family)
MSATDESTAFRSRTRAGLFRLLLIWVGFFALFRGISEIVIAFELRRAQHP